MLIRAEGGSFAKKPVLIIGWIPRIIVTIARSLQRYGVPVDVLDLSFEPRIRSRAIREFTRLPYVSLPPAEFIQRLRDLIKRRGHDMLIPASDEAIAVVTRHYDDLKDLLHLACPPPEVARLVLNKACTLQMAQQCGIPVPRTSVVSQTEQLSELLGRVELPAIVKPAEKHAHEDGFKSYIVTNREEGMAMLPRLPSSASPLLLQEYCPGAGVGVQVLLDRGEPLAIFQHRRLKEFPYTGGYAVTAVAEKPDADLVHLSLTLLRALHWEGIAMVEFRVNPADGRKVLMEVNGRYWGSLSLPVLAGMDFPLYHWKVVHGEPPNVPGAYSVGTRWRWTRGYLGRLHWLAIAATRSPGARKVLLRDLLDVTNDFGLSVRDSIFQVSDPMPTAFEVLGSARWLFLHDVNELFRRFHRPAADF